MLRYLTAPLGTEGEYFAGLVKGGRPMGAISSGVERHVDIVEVAGSKPASPTKSDKTSDFFEKIQVSEVVSCSPAI